MLLILLFSLTCSAHNANSHGTFYSPKPLNTGLARDPRVQRQGIPFVPRCYRAEYFYSLVWTLVGTEPGCGQEIGQNISVYIGLASNMGLEPDEFVKRSHRWTAKAEACRTPKVWDGTCRLNVYSTVDGRTREQRRYWFTVRYMADTSPVPDQCAGILVAYDIGGTIFVFSKALYLDMPSFESPPNNTGIRSIEQYLIKAQARVNDKCRVNLQTSILVTIPVIETSTGQVTEKTRLCLPPSQYRHRLRIASGQPCEFEKQAHLAFQRIVLNDNLTNIGFRSSSKNKEELAKDSRRFSRTQRPRIDPPASSGNFRCRASEYWYGVVSAEFVCPEACREPGTVAKCSQSTLNDLCGNKACEPTVLVNLASNPRDISVPWHLTNSGDNEVWTYYQTYGLHQQYVYQVTEEDLADERQCAALLVRVKDRKEQLVRTDHRIADQPRYGPVTDYAFTTYLPLPYWSKLGPSGQPQGMSRFVPFDKTYNTRHKCSDSQSVQIKVNFIVAFVNITDRFGRMSCVSNENYRCKDSRYMKNVWHWDAKPQAKKLVPPPKDIREVKIGNHRARTQAAAKYLKKKNQLTKEAILARSGKASYGSFFPFLVRID